MSRWYRTHVGLVTDAKLAEVALAAECSRAVVIATWHALLESCAGVNDGGRYDTTPRRVAAILGEPIAKVEAVFAAFVDLRMIEATRVTAWTRRQFESDSSTERTRKHREAKRSGELMRAHAVETPQPDKTAGERSRTPPYSYSESEDNPPSPPPDAAREPDADPQPGFERFWHAMPSPNPAAKAAALTAFARLPAADQAAAIAAAGRYASAYSAKPTTHPLSPVRFIRERCFDGFGPLGAKAGPQSAGGDLVFVRIDTPQWRAWSAYRGKPIPLNREGTGWHFPTEWPPNVQRGAA
jgi:hypothetical protein